MSLHPAQLLSHPFDLSQELQVLRVLPCDLPLRSVFHYSLQSNVYFNGLPTCSSLSWAHCYSRSSVCFLRVRTHLWEFFKAKISLYSWLMIRSFWLLWTLVWWKNYTWEV